MPPPYELWTMNIHGSRKPICFYRSGGHRLSRAVRPDLGTKFFSLAGDIESVGEFIRLYLSRYERWSAPPSAARATGHRAFSVVRLLVDRGLLSTASFDLDDHEFRDHKLCARQRSPYVFSCVLCSTLVSQKLRDCSHNPCRSGCQAEQWRERLHLALEKGDRLSQGTPEVIAKLSALHRLRAAFSRYANLRVPLNLFAKSCCAPKDVQLPARQSLQRF